MATRAESIYFDKTHADFGAGIPVCAKYIGSKQVRYVVPEKEFLELDKENQCQKCLKKLQSKAVGAADKVVIC